MIPPAKFLADGGIGNIKIFPQDVHRELAGFYDLFLSRLLINAVFVNIVEACDNLYEIFDGDIFPRLLVVFNKIFDVCNVQLLVFELGLAQNQV